MEPDEGSGNGKKCITSKKQDTSLQYDTINLLSSTTRVHIKLHLTPTLLGYEFGS